MAREILGGFGPERDIQGNRASGGGAQTPRDVMNYAAPQGPTTFSHKGPGLANHNNYGNCGSQGTSSTSATSSGSPGLHGTDRGMGTNRKG